MHGIIQGHEHHRELFRIVLGGSGCGDRALLEEAGAFHAEDVGLAGAAEAVLRDLEDALAVGLRLLLFVDVQFTTNIDSVEDRVLAGKHSRPAERALGDLSDEGDDAVGGLGPVGEHLDAADGRHRVGGAAVLAVVQRLERVLEDEDLLPRVRRAEPVGVLEEVLDEGVLTDHEAVAEPEAFRHHLHLVERFLARVVEADVTGTRDGVGQLEEHRGLAGTGRAGEHHHRGGNHALTADGVVEPLNAHLLAGAKDLGDLDLVDVRAALEALDADGEVHHLAHVLDSFRWEGEEVGRACSAVRGGCSCGVHEPTIPSPDNLCTKNVAECSFHQGRQGGWYIDHPDRAVGSELRGLDPDHVALGVLHPCPCIPGSAVLGDAGPEDLPSEAVHRDLGTLGRDTRQLSLGVGLASEVLLGALRLPGLRLGFRCRLGRCRFLFLDLLSSFELGAGHPTVLLPDCQAFDHRRTTVEELHVEGVDGRDEAVAVAVREEVGAVDPGVLLVDLEVTGLVGLPGVGLHTRRDPTPSLGRHAVGTEPHECPGAIRRAVVRVVKGV